MPESNPFTEWLRTQRTLQLTAFDTDPAQLGPEHRAEFFRWNMAALTAELGEVSNEIGWKPWATSRHLNRDEYLGELVDLLHFVGNLVLIAGRTIHGDFVLRDGTHSEEFVDVVGLADELWKRYREKVQVNLQRQRDGYDGVKEKCPICRRELADDGCTPGYCRDAGAYTPGEAQVGKGED